MLFDRLQGAGDKVPDWLKKFSPLRAFVDFGKVFVHHIVVANRRQVLEHRLFYTSYLCRTFKLFAFNPLQLCRVKFIDKIGEQSYQGVAKC